MADFQIPTGEEEMMNEGMMDFSDESPVLKVGEEKEIGKEHLMKKLVKEGEDLDTPDVGDEVEDDGADDFWGEDGGLDGGLDDDLSHSSVLDREWKRRHDQFHTIGYRDGITAGKEASAQEGFNVGFKQSVHVGHKWGLVRGISSALANLPDRLKENLSGTPENREKLQKLYESVLEISSNDALGLFYDGVKEAAARQPDDRPDGNFRETAMKNENLDCNQLEKLFEELISLLHEAPQIKPSAESGREMAV